MPESEHMKLNKNDRIRYDGSIYEVVAIVMATIYLREVGCSDSYNGNCYDMRDVQKMYRDIEIMEKRK